MNRRAFLRVGASTVVGGLAIGGYAVGIEPEWVELVRRPMSLPHLPDALVGRTLLQVSDLHVSPAVRAAYLRATLRGAAALDPDFVVVTGDFVTYSAARRPDDLARVLEALPRGRLATLASLGNHDYGDGWGSLGVADALSRVVTDAGATLLRNEVVTVAGLQVAGLADVWSPEFDPGPVLARLDRDRPTVVLTHNPDTLDLPVWEGVQGWALAGHTHGGQCRPPFLPPPILPVRNRRYTAGAFDVGAGRTLYVNRGLGYLLRVRLNVRPEVTLFTLARA